MLLESRVAKEKEREQRRTLMPFCLCHCECLLIMRMGRDWYMSVDDVLDDVNQLSRGQEAEKRVRE